MGECRPPTLFCGLNVTIRATNCLTQVIFYVAVAVLWYHSHFLTSQVSLGLRGISVLLPVPSVPTTAKNENSSLVANLPILSLV